MFFAVVRVVHNDNGYQRPSGGKLNQPTESSYAKENGFGHEEWNFNKTLLIGGKVHGYHYYNPALNKRSSLFTLFFVTYTKRKWHLIGRYRDAQYTATGAPNSQAVTRQKLADLRALDAELGKSWANLTDQQIAKRLADSEAMRWSATPENVQLAPSNTLVPEKLIFDNDFRRNFHESSATLISAFDAYRLESLLGKTVEAQITTNLLEDLTDPDLGVEEGHQKMVTHLKRERNKKVIQEKKADVFDKTGGLACEACTFDFVQAYGLHGQDFCEVHHLKRLADVKGKTVTTSLKDLAVVCSNCHRMLHRGSPMLTLKKLIEFINAAKLAIS